MTVTTWATRCEDCRGTGRALYLHRLAVPEPDHASGRGFRLAMTPVRGLCRECIGKRRVRALLGATGAA